MNKKKLDKPVLAEGEHTGHAHRLPATCTVYENSDGTREFDLEEPAELTHEEHAPIVLPADKFQSGIVREYDHFAEEARQVQD